MVFLRDRRLSDIRRRKNNLGQKKFWGIAKVLVLYDHPNVIANKFVDCRPNNVFGRQTTLTYYGRVVQRL